MASLPAIREPRSSVPGKLGPDLETAVRYARAEKAPATRRAYETDHRLFVAWCEAKGIASNLPAAAETVAAFLAAEAEAGSRTSTLGRRLAAIRYFHKLAGLPTPTDAEAVKATLRGIRRSMGSAKARKAPALAEHVKAMVAASPDSLRGKRDRALVLLGFAGAFRRSELVALNVADIEEVELGLRILIRRSKTDQEGRGSVIGVTRGTVACPVSALREWLVAGEITAGPLFRPVNKANRPRNVRLTSRSVANIIKEMAQTVGLDASTFSGHSLRSGFLTSAASKGASIFKMMDVSRHRSVETLRGYVRDSDVFKDHAGSGLL
ncbi:site-specific integrase [Bradyrhizobium jicamae]|uniref:Site-specific integrase n=1 Tax=Bradyrhizobium jicamae TaxID=280332 RepID=A0ABS5FQ70_9BRAD|nr:site-specific integrase [Bradyrhizobium jicamae]MBR0798951.1 site-specific integrase [Bradyrhizobium jicamae]